MKILENGVVRNATPTEIAQRAADEAAEAAHAATVVPPTKEQLLAELQALTAKINALG